MTQPISILDRVTTILMGHLGVTEDMVKPEARIIDDLGADSLDTAELALIAEEEFEIHLRDDDIDRVETVADFVNAIVAALTRAEAA